MGIIVHFKIEPKRNETLHQSLICSLVLNEYDHFHNSFFFFKSLSSVFMCSKKEGKTKKFSNQLDCPSHLMIKISIIIHKEKTILFALKNKKINEQ